MVYVLNKNGQPLMPTKNNAKVRILLRSKKAKIINKCPFTIQLLYDTTNHTQPVNLGVDSGSHHIGISATTKNKVLYEADVELRNDIVDLISTKKALRQARRFRKTRYRKARFMNRVHSKRQGWVAPSIKNKIDTHLTVIKKITHILPISKIIVEVASFDVDKIKNPEITGTEYQNGEQQGMLNVREYVLFRDKHTCQCCKGKSKDKILNVHHIESRRVGGNAPNNLVTLCKTCHDGYHAGTIKLPNSIKRGMSFRDAAFMGIMRWKLYEQLKNIYPNVSLTYGYITKATRISNELSKDHYIDARCISGNPLAKSENIVFYQKKIRCHNRQIYKNTIQKGGIRKRNQADYEVNGFRLFDAVLYDNKPYIIFGRRNNGFFDIRNLNGDKVNNGSISCKKLKLLYPNSGFIIEKRNIV